MAIITISLTAFAPYFIDGIPRQIELETNIPAIIAYTLDGTEPTLSSSIYTDPIIMPTENSVRVRVLAVSGTDTGTLDTTFGPDISKLYFPRRSQDVGGMGVVIDAYGFPVVLQDGYGADADGNVNVVVRRSDYELEDLEIKYSSTGTDGYGTLIRLGPYPPEFWEDHAVEEEASSPNDSNVFFNPRSLYIVIDGRVADGYSDESVYMINRNIFGTMDDVKYMNGKNFFTPTPIVSGGLARTCINYETGLRVSYYWDAIECRWIKSIQTFDTTKLPEGIGMRRQIGPGLVVPWIFGRRSILV